VSDSRPSASTPVAGPTISFGFNLGKIKDQGEDSDPILRDGPDLGLIAVFDGMGGAGGTVYETPDGPRTGAYLASRVARDVVERRMLELLEPDWNLNGEATAQDLRRAVRQALVERLAELKAPKSGLRSRLLRALPTTMALVALQRSQPGGPTWTCHVLWAGDSRAYAFEPEGGARQLTTDDIRDEGDAMLNLRQDSVVSNAMSADTDFHVNYRKVTLRAPFLIAAATDGCFGYVPSPMHFEHLVLATMEKATSTDEWSSALQSHISVVTGDDAAMSLLGVGASFEDFQALFAERVDQLERAFTAPLDELRTAVETAEQELEAARRRQVQGTAELWSTYKPGYERYLRPEVASSTTRRGSDEGSAEPRPDDAAGEDDGLKPEEDVPAEEALPDQPAEQPEDT
jgi:serine/threonine protein phosphatase PrpC